MKLKLAILFGIIIWFITYVLSLILDPIFTTFFPQVNLTIPIIIILITGLFGILYIRNIDKNEVVEGILVGIIFIIIDIILDLIVFIIPQRNTFIFGNFTIHVISMIIITLFITTFLGYLAQMNIDLK